MSMVTASLAMILSSGTSPECRGNKRACVAGLKIAQPGLTPMLKDTEGRR